jgi:hypothetical protein
MLSALRRMLFHSLMWSMAAFRRIPDAQARVTKCRQWPMTRPRPERPLKVCSEDGAYTVHCCRSTTSDKKSEDKES